MSSRRRRFSAKEEAGWQRSRWKAKELVQSRRRLAETMKQRPWIPLFYRSSLMSRTGGRISGLLDVGCGSGFLARFFGRGLLGDGGVSRIVGVDISGKSLQAASEEEGKERVSVSRRVDYIQADVYHLPFRRSTFGLVTSRTFLMHLTSPEKALREMARVCRRDGFVAPVEPDWGAFSSYNPKESGAKEVSDGEVVLRAEIRGRKKLYGQDPTIGRRLPDLLHRAGLKEITIDGIFEVPMTPCDLRTSRRSLISEDSLAMKHLSDRKRTDEYVKVLVAGGLSEAWIRRYLGRRKARLVGRLRQLKSHRSKEGMTSFFAIPFFLAIGKK